ncbi:MAG TPA: glycosyltransferase family 4 protein [Parafilimonas sp.]|nr:glycosyltransferase family 4 protein [Parafilimonas sp.]
MAEGELYIPFINEITKKPNCFYLPNFIPVEEVPDNIPGKLQQELLKVLFVGYCYEGKGVFELLEGLNLAAKKGIKISLTLVGSESHKFQDYMFVFKNDENLLINRKGVQPHEVVLEEMRLNDIYVYPTRHSGEGHTNSINEAMMNNMVIITTHAGFLSSILSDCAFFLKTVTAEEIAQTLLLISNNRPLALEKASAARTKFLDNYTSRTQIPKMNSFYQFALNGNH